MPEKTEVKKVDGGGGGKGGRGRGKGGSTLGVVPKFAGGKSFKRVGIGGGLVVSVLTFNSNDRSMSHAEVHSIFFAELLEHERKKINKKRQGIAYL